MWTSSEHEIPAPCCEGTGGGELISQRLSSDGVFEGGEGVGERDEVGVVA
jgi:hypothetical protein